MNQDYTHISIIIDRSGSMQNGWNDVVGGYESIIKKQKKQPGKCTLTVAAFDNDYELVEDFTDIQKVNEKLLVSPRGMTALLDAIGKTINGVGEKLAALSEEDRPAKVVFQVQTDGQENASREFTCGAIKQLIEKQTNNYNWQFIFLGADLSSVEQAKNWGFDINNVTTYNTKNYGATMEFMNCKMTMARSCVSSDLATTMAVTNEEKTAIN